MDLIIQRRNKDFKKIEIFLDFHFKAQLMIIWAISLKREQNTDLEILLDFYIKAQITIKNTHKKEQNMDFSMFYLILTFKT